MPVSIVLMRWTDQGVRTVQDTVTRTRANLSAIEKAGGKMTVYWTQGRYDLIGIVEGPIDDETGSAIALSAVKAGNFRTETLRAFTIDEMERILKKVP
ncbi:MAG: GYD domain-containing protein [Spirochaetia bacterium]|jgi:uncharacterized protein with GYD domain